MVPGHLILYVQFLVYHRAKLLDLFVEVSDDDTNSKHISMSPFLSHDQTKTDLA